MLPTCACYQSSSQALQIFSSFFSLTFGDMLSKDKLAVLLSLIMLFLLWKETQGRCSSCPSNGCSQTGMSQGWAVIEDSSLEFGWCLWFETFVYWLLFVCRKCFRARYYTQSYQTSYYVTTYYQGTSQGSSTYRCDSWFRQKMCTRYQTVYHRRYLHAYMSITTIHGAVYSAD